MKTKIYLFASLLLAVLCFACSDDNGGGVQTTAVTISLNYPDGINAKEGVKVTIRNTVTDASFDATTDANGGFCISCPPVYTRLRLQNLVLATMRLTCITV